MSSQLFMPGYQPLQNRSSYLRAEGNLTYLGFIRVLEYMWKEAYPDIPLYATGLDTYPVYPCIIYRLDLRKTHSNEPKQRHREMIHRPDEQTDIQVLAQRFQNIVTFCVYTQTNAQLAEEIIEIFEDFMIEYIPVFKQLGLSEIIYYKRDPDTGQRRDNVDVIERSVSFLVTTEKVVTREREKLRNIYIDVRRYIEDATPVNITVEYDATPQVRIIDSV